MNLKQTSKNISKRRRFLYIPSKN